MLSIFAIRKEAAYTPHSRVRAGQNKWIPLSLFSRKEKNEKVWPLAFRPHPEQSAVVAGSARKMKAPAVQRRRMGGQRDTHRTCVSRATVVALAREFDALVSSLASGRHGWLGQVVCRLRNNNKPACVNHAFVGAGTGNVRVNLCLGS